MTTYQQISMFDEDEIVRKPSRQDAIRDIEWSYSRSDCFEQCLLRYYYEYFGANKKKARDEPLKEKLHMLKASANCYLRTGTILHLNIAKFFRNAQVREAWTLHDATAWAVSLLRKDINYSRQYPNLPEVTDRFPPILLREYIDQPLEADGLYERATERMLQCLARFYSDERYEEFRVAGSDPEALIEHPMHLKSLPCKVAGKIDLAYSSNGLVTIVDWKSGSSTGLSEDSLQLGAYGLWAIDHYGGTPDTLRVCKVHLGSGEVDFFPISADILDAARFRIIQDAERMAALERWAKQGVAEVFTPNKRENVCKLCAFKGVCYD